MGAVIQWVTGDALASYLTKEREKPTGSDPKHKIHLVNAEVSAKNQLTTLGGSGWDSDRAYKDLNTATDQLVDKAMEVANDRLTTEPKEEYVSNRSFAATLIKIPIQAAAIVGATALVALVADKAAGRQLPPTARQAAWAAWGVPKLIEVGVCAHNLYQTNQRVHKICTDIQSEVVTQIAKLSENLLPLTALSTEDRQYLLLEVGNILAPAFRELVIMHLK